MLVLRRETKQHLTLTAGYPFYKAAPQQSFLFTFTTVILGWMGPLEISASTSPPHTSPSSRSLEQVFCNSLVKKLQFSAQLSRGFIFAAFHRKNSSSPALCVPTLSNHLEVIQVKTFISSVLAGLPLHVVSCITLKSHSGSARDHLANDFALTIRLPNNIFCAPHHTGRQRVRIKCMLCVYKHFQTPQIGFTSTVHSNGCKWI